MIFAPWIGLTPPIDKLVAYTSRQAFVQARPRIRSCFSARAMGSLLPLLLILTGGTSLSEAKGVGNGTTTPAAIAPVEILRGTGFSPIDVLGLAVISFLFD